MNTFYENQQKTIIYGTAGIKTEKVHKEIDRAKLGSSKKEENENEIFPFFLS